MHPEYKVAKARFAAMSYSSLLNELELYQEKESFSDAEEILFDLLVHELDARDAKLTEHRRQSVEEDYGSFDCVH